nr:hypothetical protein [Tanacetum cinerariifolium]
MALGYQNPFYLKQAQKKQQCLYDKKALLEKHDPPVVYDSEEILQLAQESREKMKQLNKEIKPANYTKINHLLGVFVPQTALSCVNNDNVIAPRMFRINPFKTSKEEKHVPNTVSASARTKPINVLQPPVITKKDVNSDLLINFFWKFMGTVRFGNDHVAAILGFGDLQWEIS